MANVDIPEDQPIEVTVDLPGLDQVSLTSVGVVNSPNLWGGGHLPALWARTAV